MAYPYLRPFVKISLSDCFACFIQHLLFFQFLSIRYFRVASTSRKFQLVIGKGESELL